MMDERVELGIVESSLQMARRSATWREYVAALDDGIEWLLEREALVAEEDGR